MKMEFHIFCKEELTILLVACVLLGLLVFSSQVWKAYCHEAARAEIAAIQAHAQEMIVAQSWPTYQWDKKAREWKVQP